MPNWLRLMDEVMRESIVYILRDKDKEIERSNSFDSVEDTFHRMAEDGSSYEDLKIVRVSIPADRVSQYVSEDDLVEIIERKMLNDAPAFASINSPISDSHRRDLRNRLREMLDRWQAENRIIIRRNDRARFHDVTSGEDY